MAVSPPPRQQTEARLMRDRGGDAVSDEQAARVAECRARVAAGLQQAAEGAGAEVGQ